MSNYTSQYIQEKHLFRCSIMSHSVPNNKVVYREQSPRQHHYGQYDVLNNSTTVEAGRFLIPAYVVCRKGNDFSLSVCPKGVPM